MRARLTLLVAGAAVAAVAAVGTSPASVTTSSACAAAKVHWDPHPQPLGRAALTMPWIQASPASAGLVGYLFYYTPHSEPVILHRPGVRIYTHARGPRRSVPQILWVPERDSGLFVTIKGRRLDGRGHFRQRFASVNGGGFLTAPNIPHAGCWRLTLRSENLSAHVTVLAVNAGRR